MTSNKKKESKKPFPTLYTQIIYISGRGTLYISKSGTDSEKCGSMSNPCRTSEQLWKQIQQDETSTNSTVVITDTDIVINHRDKNLQNNQKNFHLIHIISKEEQIQININCSTLRGVRLKLDNNNISLHIQNSRLIDAGINIESEGNRGYQPVKIASCNFSGQFPENTLLFNNTKNVYIESCHFNDLKSSNDKSFIIKAVDSILHIKNSEFRNNPSCMEAQKSTVNISMSLFEGNTNGCIHGNKALLHIADTSFTRNKAKRGAAVKAQETYITLERCSLIQNTATGKDWRNGRDGGGAIYISTNSSLDARDTNITLNTAGRGGAVLAWDNSQVSLDSCSLISNSARYDGGAVCILDGSSLKMTDSNLTLNTAGRGGAVFAWTNSQVSLDSCSLISNSATEYDGGAVYILDGSSLNMTDTNLTLNTAEGSGGAVYAWSNCQVSLDSCSLISNSATEYDGGAVCILDGSSLNMTDTNLTLNTGSGGGAVLAWSNSQVSLDSCSLISNSAIDGGAVCIFRWFITKHDRF